MDYTHLSPQHAEYSHFDAASYFSSPDWENDSIAINGAAYLDPVSHVFSTKGALFSTGFDAEFAQAPSESLDSFYHLDNLGDVSTFASEFAQPVISPFSTYNSTVEILDSVNVRHSSQESGPWNPAVAAAARKPGSRSVGDTIHGSLLLRAPSELDCVSYSQLEDRDFSVDTGNSSLAYPDPSVTSGSSGDGALVFSTVPSPFAYSVDMNSDSGSKLVSLKDDIEMSQARSVASSSKTKSSRGGKQTCQQCEKVLKCPSDFKKHMLTHDKPHKCTIPGCTRTEGFGTINDLDRHKASVHKLASSAARNFKCAAPGCRTAEKIWPRLDNFKQHLERMHKNIDMESMIEESERRAKSRSKARDTILGGVGAGADSSNLFQRPSTSQKSRVRNASWGANDQAPDTSQQDDTSEAGTNTEDNDRLQVLSHLATIQSQIPQGQITEKSALSTFATLAQGLAEANPKSEIFKNMHQMFQTMGNKGSRRGSKTSSEDNAPSVGGAIFPCSQCSRSFVRRCDLKKHLKRHVRPYMCTAAGCNHCSGSKFDWQRHESSCTQRGKEHIDADGTDRYRVCLERDRQSKGNTGKCGFLHTNRDCFERHLQESHNIVDPATLARCLAEYEMRTKPGTGWCGFCLQHVRWSKDSHVIGSTQNLQNGYGKHNDRANHIDMHVTKEGRTMGAYVSLEQHLKKQDGKPDDMQLWFQNRKPEDHDPRIHNPEYKGKQAKKRKLRQFQGEALGSDGEDRKKKLGDAKWGCCQCPNSANPFSYILHQDCSSCSHERCVNCADPYIKSQPEARLYHWQRHPDQPPWDSENKYLRNES